MKNILTLNPRVWKCDLARVTAVGKMSTRRAEGETKAIVSPFLRAEGMISVISQWFLLEE